jgi:RNA polymerase sigma factor (sigma-70 family)
MRTVTVTAGRQAGPQLSRRLLALAGDDRLVEQIRRGNEAAFAVAFERHSGPILSFCRHMLGSREEAEDAVQHTFAAAYSNLLEDEREIRLKPWLYAIARNRCLSLLRARREQASDELEIETIGLQEQVQNRAELRDILRDLGDLPDEQREALLLAELGDLPHAEIAGVLDCEVARVKALVFRARSGLMERRDARDTPCAEVREQLANLRGGSLRRSEIKHHLRVCEGCREYRAEVRRQRTLLAAALPVVPTTGFKGGVLGAILGYGGGSAGGGAAAAGGSSAVAKLALAGVLVGGGAVAGTTALEHGAKSHDRSAPVERPAPAAAAEARQLSPGGALRQAASRGRTAHRRHSAAWRRRHAASRPSRLVAGSAPAATSNGDPARGNSGNAPGHAVNRGKAKKPKKTKVHPPRARAHPRPPKAQGPPVAAPPQSAPPKKPKDVSDEAPAAGQEGDKQDQ